MRARWTEAALTAAVVVPLVALVVAASYLGMPWMVAAATLCFALTFALAAVATSMLRRLTTQHGGSVGLTLTLVHMYVPLLPVAGIELAAAAIAPLVGIHRLYDLSHTSRGWLFLLACFIVGGSIYLATLGLVGRGWRALVRRLDVEDTPAHGGPNSP